MNQGYAPVQGWSAIPQPQGYTATTEESWNYGNTPAPQNQYPQQGGYQEQYPQNGYQSQQPYSSQGGYENQQYPQQGYQNQQQYPQQGGYQEQQQQYQQQKAGSKREENRNPHQICKVGGNNCFVESMDSMFSIGKIRLNLSSYDPKQPKGARQKNFIPIVIDAGEFLDLCRRMENGEILWTIQNARQTGVTPPVIYKTMGGTSAEDLAKYDRRRADGKAESRIMQISVGQKADIIVSAESGSGEKVGFGLIKPTFKDKPDQRVNAGMSYGSFCAFLMKTRQHYLSWLFAYYMKQP